QFGLVMAIVGMGANNAWTPFLFRHDAERGEAARPELARLATVYVLALCWIGLAIALFVRPALRLLTPPAYHGAESVAVWLVVGSLVAAVYTIPVNFLFLKSHTKWAPVLTVSAGAANIALNLWLVPRYGIRAAAWSTVATYALLLVLSWAVARRLFR